MNRGEDFSKKWLNKHCIQVGFNTIKYRLLLAFLFFTFIIIFMSGVSTYYLWEIEAVTGFNANVQELRSQTLQLVNEDVEALNIEMTNPAFFTRSSTKRLQERDKSYLELDSAFQKAIDQYRKIDSPDLPDMEKIRSNLDSYNQVFHEIIEMQQIRGFKDFGLEGEMRRYVHQLEKAQPELSLDKVLSLRRHEKDFFLRNDTSYVIKLNQLCTEIINELRANAANEDVNAIVALVTNYRNTFNELVRVQGEIGLKDQSGLKAQMNHANRTLNELFYAASQQSRARTADIILNVKVHYAITCLVCIILSLLLSFLISISISKPIRKLSDFMDRFILNHLSPQESIKMEPAPYEIENLASSYSKMIRQLKKQYREISEKKKSLEDKNKELVKLNEELDRFAYSVSHDLRAPLTSMLGLIDLAGTDISTSTNTDYLEMMRISVNRMDGFIQDILHFSRNKSMEVRAESLDLHQFITDIFEHNTTSDQKIVRFECTMGSKAPFFSDRQRIRMIFNNLISNAIRYRDAFKPESFVKIHMEVTTTLATITVEDNGLGISREHLPQIFNMFYRASSNSKGSGLGLYIVQEAIHKLHGSIKVNSQVGEGTKFFLVIPNLIDRVLTSEYPLETEYPYEKAVAS